MCCLYECTIPALETTSPIYTRPFWHLCRGHGALWWSVGLSGHAAGSSEVSFCLFSTPWKHESLLGSAWQKKMGKWQLQYFNISTQSPVFVLLLVITNNWPVIFNTYFNISTCFINSITSYFNISTHVWFLPVFLLVIPCGPLTAGTLRLVWCFTCDPFYCKEHAPGTWLYISFLFPFYIILLDWVIQS